MYATILQLINAFGIVETVRVSQGDAAPFLVTAELFSAAAKGESLPGGTTPEEEAAVAAAIEKAGDALVQSSRTMDSYLGVRFTLPLSPDVVEANGLRTRCLNIGRYLLHDDRATEEIRHRYKDDMTWLREIRDGKAQLIGAEGGGSTAPTGGSIRHGQARSGFDWDGF
jgi:phage gp36-like protein